MQVEFKEREKHLGIYALSAHIHWIQALDEPIIQANELIMKHRLRSTFLTCCKYNILSICKQVLAEFVSSRVAYPSSSFLLG